MACQFVVTGFGAFHGVECNPTTRLVERLARYCDDADAEAPGFLEHLQTKILKVAAKEVKDWLEGDLYPVMEQSDTPVIVVHLGVDSKAEQIRLEWQAFNDATFRVPDEDGWQPEHEAIELSQEHPLGTRLVTRLPIPALLGALNCKGYPVQASHDAGRFVCNWSYYISLMHCKHHTKPPPSNAVSPCQGTQPATHPAPEAVQRPPAGQPPPRESMDGRIGEVPGSADAYCPQQLPSQQPPCQPLPPLESVGSWQLLPDPAEAGTGTAAAEGSGASAATEQDATGGAVSMEPEQQQLRQLEEPCPSDAAGELHSGGSPPRYALFVHVPPFEVVPERVQFGALLDLLHLLARSVEAGEEATAEDAAQGEAVGGEEREEKDEAEVVEEGLQREGAAAAGKSSGGGAAGEAGVERAGGDVAAETELPQGAPDGSPSEQLAPCAIPAAGKAGQQGANAQRRWPRLLSCKVQ